jgi:hypothetical protein
MVTRKRELTGEDAAIALPSAPAVPLRRVRIRRQPAQRVGGYLLTERGWIPETPQGKG